MPVFFLSPLIHAVQIQKIWLRMELLKSKLNSKHCFGGLKTLKLKSYSTVAAVCISPLKPSVFLNYKNNWAVHWCPSTFLGMKNFKQKSPCWLHKALDPKHTSLVRRNIMACHKNVNILKCLLQSMYTTYRHDRHALKGYILQMSLNQSLRSAVCFPSYFPKLGVKKCPVSYCLLNSRP